jgi:tol-pal system protein YbgF
MIAKHALPAVLTAALLASALGATAAWAQSDQGGPAAAAPAPGIEWDKKRLDRLERAVDRLENTIAHQRPDRAPPNLVEPDPEVIALESRTDDLTQRLTDLQDVLTKVNGALDTANIEITRSHKAEADERAANEELKARVAQLETKLTAMEQAAQAAQAAQAGAPNTLGGGAAGQPGDGGGAAAPSDPAGDFKVAMDLILSNDFTGAGRAFNAFVTKYPDDAHAPEAHYWLGEIAFRLDDQQNAVAEYAKAIERYPKAKWAPDAMVKLARGLAYLKHPHEACAALGEFETRYARSAGASVKASAASVKTAAKCK